MSRSVNLDNPNKAANKDPRDNYDDNQLARLFIQANIKSQESEETEIIDIFQENEESFENYVFEPSQELKEELKKSIVNEKEFHHDLIDVHLEPGFFNLLKHKFKKFIYKDAISSTNESKELIPADWIFLKKYSFEWKKYYKKYWHDMSIYTELFLKKPKNLKNILFYEIWLFFLGLTFSVFISLWMKRISSGTPDTEMYSFIVNYKYSVFMLNIFAVLFFTFPYILLMIMWFINVNRLHCSKNYHYFLATCTFIGYLLISLCFFVLGMYYILDAVFEIKRVHY